VLVPFDLVTIDSQITNFRKESVVQSKKGENVNEESSESNKKTTIFENIIEICKFYMD
jgi:hypothetical protein